MKKICKSFLAFGNSVFMTCDSCRCIDWPAFFFQMIKHLLLGFSFIDVRTGVITSVLFWHAHTLTDDKTEPCQVLSNDNARNYPRQSDLLHRKTFFSIAKYRFDTWYIIVKNMLCLIASYSGCADWWSEPRSTFLS